jgi:hypothetical protein
MKMIKFLIVLFTISIGATSFGQDKDFRGLVYAQGMIEADGENPEMTSAEFRLWQNLNYGENSGLYVESNARSKGNELEQLYLYTDILSGTVKAGRLFVAAPWGTPAPHYTPVARYPRAALSYNFYGYGVQYNRQLTEDWSLMYDITGKTGVTYDSDEVFDQAETSFRLKRKISSGYVAYGGQFSEDSVRLSVDSEMTVDRLYGFLGVYYADDTHRDNKVSAFSYVTYEVASWLKPHVQWDKRPDGENVGTVGIMFGSFEHVSLYTDYEINGPTEGFVARAQVRYDF